MKSASRVGQRFAGVFLVNGFGVINMSYQELNEVVWRWISDSQTAKSILVVGFVGLAIVWQFFRFQSSVRLKQRVQAATDAYAEREYSQYEFSSSLYE